MPVTTLPTLGHCDDFLKTLWYFQKTLWYFDPNTVMSEQNTVVFLSDISQKKSQPGVRRKRKSRTFAAA
jgi:hypothetical protein